MRNKRSISYCDYYAKVMGGWKGKCIAGTLGAPYEGWNMIFHFNSIADYDRKVVAGNDDVDVQLVWLSEMYDVGINLTSEDMIKGFYDHYFQWKWNEYAYSQRNYLRGIHPPLSGIYGNGFFKESEGCPIRAEIWGMIAPGNPSVAAEYAERDGCIDHDINGAAVHAERFIAAMAAEAFFTTDMETVIDAGLVYMPSGSKLYTGLTKVIECYKNGVELERARKIIDRDYAHNDCSNAVYNTCVVVLALLYGEGDFDKTVTYALNGGADTDCTCATVGAILGIMYTSAGIPEDQLTTAGNSVITGIDNLHIEINTYDKLTTATCVVGINMARQGLHQTAIQAPPADTPKLTYKPTPDFAFEVDYNGLPELDIDEPAKKIDLKVSNNLGYVFKGRLEFSCPDQLIVSGYEADISLIPGENIINFEVAVANGVLVPEMNTVSIHLINNKEDRAASYSFGLIGAAVWHIVGPFRDWRDFDSLPKDKREQREICGKMTYAHNFDIDSGIMDGELNYADIESYCEDSDRSDTSFGAIDDDRLAVYEYFNTLYEKGFRYSAKEEFLKTNDMFGMEGACCAYALQKLYVDENLAEGIDIEFWTGSTDPWKIWINGSLVHVQNRIMGYCDYSKAFKQHLNPGLNTVIVKIVRVGQREQNQKLRIAPMFYAEDGYSPIRYGR